MGGLEEDTGERKEKIPIPRDAYERIAERYDAQSGDKIENAYLERPATLSILPPVKGGVVLDAGCGLGIYADWPVRHAATVIAFDASPKMVGMARAKLGPGSQKGRSLRWFGGFLFSSRRWP